jgi:hypothetical protein
MFQSQWSILTPLLELCTKSSMLAMQYKQKNPQFFTTILNKYPQASADLLRGQPGPWPPQQNCKVPTTLQSVAAHTKIRPSSSISRQNRTVVSCLPYSQSPILTWAGRRHGSIGGGWRRVSGGVRLVRARSSVWSPATSRGEQQQGWNSSFLSLLAMARSA